MSQTTPDVPPDLADKRRLEATESFCFGCRSDLPCFTRCCADINILLTPVDVLRLSRRLGISTTDGGVANFTLVGDAPWLSADPSTGTTPATVDVLVDPSGLAPDTSVTSYTICLTDNASSDHPCN